MLLGKKKGTTTDMLDDLDEGQSHELREAGLRDEIPCHASPFGWCSQNDKAIVTEDKSVASSGLGSGEGIPINELRKGNLGGDGTFLYLDCANNYINIYMF